MTSARRLLAINNYFYRRGGAESVFLDHIDLFVAAGWDVVPFAMEHPDNLPSPWSDYFVSEIEYGRSSGPLTKVRQAAKIIFSLEARVARRPRWRTPTTCTTTYRHRSSKPSRPRACRS
jgi:hypothetical protein